MNGIHWWRVDFPHKGPVMQKAFPYYGIIMFKYFVLEKEAPEIIA